MTDSVALQIQNAIVYTIQQLSLTGVASNEIVARKLPQDPRQFRKGITVSYGDDQQAAGTNERDDVVYSFYVTCYQGTSNGLTDDMDRVTMWRQKIRRAFNEQRLTGSTGVITEVYVCKVFHGKQFVPKSLQASTDHSVQLVRVWSREQRTT